MKKQILLLIASCTLAGSITSQTIAKVGTQGFNDQVLCLYTDPANNTLYAGGAFTAVDGKRVNGIAKWDGTNWSAMDSGFRSTTAYGAVVYAITKYNNELYAGGYFSASDTRTVNNIAKWDGSKWVAVDIGMSTTGSYDFISAMLEFNGELYVGGKFTKAGSANADNIAKWNGTTWAEVAGGVNDRVSVLAVHDNHIYMGGYFVLNNATSNLQYRIAKLTNNQWVNMGTKGLGDANDYWNVRALATYDNNLIAGGWFNVLDNTPSKPAKHMGMWDGTTWTALGNGLTPAANNPKEPVRAMMVYDDNLYVAGNLSKAGYTPVTNITAWNGTTWNSVGVQFDDAVNALAIYDGKLIAAGRFENVNSQPYNYIVQLSSMTLTGIRDVENSIAVSTCYPNPMGSSATVIVNRSNPLINATVEVLDMTGKTAYNLSNINGNTISLQRNNLSAGLYTYRVIEGNVLVATGKIAVE